MEGLNIPIGAPLNQLNKDLNGAKSKFKNFANSAENDLGKMSNGIQNQLSKIGPLLAATFSIGAIASFGKEVLNTTAEFEKFEAVLGNTLGSSSLAKLKLKEIQEFASKTPFSVNELTGAFVKLANQGFKPTGDEMRRLGDLASSTGKTFDMLAEAILDAQTGEFERLKEFGVKAKDAGDNVIFTFKGVQTTVEKSSEAIKNYVTSLGDAVGVSGSMSVISETLTGKMSNLGDSWDMMLLSVGSNTTGIFTSAIDLISTAIGKITEFNKDLNTASKYKIQDKGSGNVLNALSPVLDLFTRSNKDIKVDNIQAIQDELSGFVSKTTDGAKSANDFSVAIANLKTQGDKLLNEGWEDKNLVAAFKSIYEEAIKTLKDGRREFLNEANKAAEAKSVKDKAAAAAAAKAAAEAAAKLIDLRNQLEDAKIALISDAGNLAIDRADIIRNQLSKIQNNKDITGTPTSLKPVQVPIASLVDSLEKHKPAFLNSLATFNGQVTNLINDGLIGAFVGIGDAIGNALSNGTSVIGSFGASLLSTLGAVLGQLGQMAIATGIAILGIKKALQTLNPFVAIGAGVALLALSGVVKGKLSKMGSSMGSGGGGGNISMPGQSISSSTSSFTNSADFSGGRVVFEISGVNLVGVLNRAGQKLARY